MTAASVVDPATPGQRAAGARHVYLAYQQRPTRRPPRSAGAATLMLSLSLVWEYTVDDAATRKASARRVSWAKTLTAESWLATP